VLRDNIYAELIIQKTIAKGIIGFRLYYSLYIITF